MSNSFKKSSASLLATALGALFLASIGVANAAESKVVLSGAEETPPVNSSATGKAAIKIDADKSISGNVDTQGVAGTAVHIHAGDVGKKGPPIVTLKKVSDNSWAIPEGTKLTDEQLASYNAGQLYINVHSSENKGGEIRGQLKP